jgi:hypothetical protein
MSVEVTDILPLWKNYYLKNIQVRPDLQSFSEQRLKGFLLRAKQAVKNERNRKDYIVFNNGRQDDEEEAQFGISDYERERKLLDFCGDLPIIRRWWHIFDSDVDATTGLKFWAPDYYEDEIDEDWYTKSPEEFNKTIKLLSPWAKQRQYGRVFFGTETKYISKEAIVPPAVKSQVRGYYKVSSDWKICVPFIPKQRSDIYYPPKTGTRILKYKKTKFLFHHTGTGILKIRNFEGQRYHYLVQRIQTIEQELGPLNTRRHNQESVGAVLFDELRSHHFDLEVWANIFSRSIQTEQENHIEQQHLIHIWNRYESPKKKRKKEKERALRRIKHSVLVRRVQRLWFSANRTTSILGSVATVQQRAWRNYVFRGLGTRRTIIGQLGKKVP